MSNISISSRALVAAGFLVFRRIKGNIEYLLLQTSYGENHWTPPKEDGTNLDDQKRQSSSLQGHVDPGETEIETAYRETQEEAGLTRHHLRIIDGFKKTLNYEVSGIHKRVVYWLSELMDPNTSITLSDEHIRFEWRQLDKALELISRFENMQETLKEAEEFIKTLQQSPATVNNTNTDTDNI